MVLVNWFIDPRSADTYRLGGEVECGHYGWHSDPEKDVQKVGSYYGKPLQRRRHSPSIKHISGGLEAEPDFST